MLKQGANVNAKDGRGLTPLMYCAVVGSAQAMKLLINKGADVNSRNAFGSTALMWSVTDREKVRLLVEHGADLNAASKKKHTALLLAVMSDQSAEIQIEPGRVFYGPSGRLDAGQFVHLVVVPRRQPGR